MDSRLLQEWRFFYGDEPEAFNREFDDSAWSAVVVPHDWAVSFPFSRAHSSGTGYLPGGMGWYRTFFDVPEDTAHAFVTFDGVYKNAQVWLNGYYLGKRPNGYIGFTYDVSPYIRRDGRNLLAVKVTHTDIADSRWFTGSGIYRKVRLCTYGGAYIPPDSVVFSFDGENANIEARLVGKVSGPLTVSLGEREWQIDTAGKDGFDIRMNARLDNPRLWSPDTPNLYTLAFKADGASLCEPLRVGLRTFTFDADRGFSLNGVPMKFKGVCVHHDAGCLGAAVWADVWRRRLEKLRGAGCNAIRTSHNPHMPELYDLCDEMGFFVMDEAFDEWEGCKNKWVRGHNVYPPSHQGYAEDFPEWHERDLAAMVVRDRNHASVVMWSVGNEIDYPNDPYVHPLFTQMTGNNDKNKPAREMRYNDNKPNAERLAVVAKRLAKIVRQYDTTRPVLAASAFPELSSQIGFFDAFDIIGYNYKEHLYAKDHERFPKLPILGSENGHREDQWNAVKDNDYISGQFLWTGIDFLGEARGWPVRGSQAGILTTAGYEKNPKYYDRQLLWTGGSDAPAADFGRAEKVRLDVYPTVTNEGDYRLYQIEVSVRDGNGRICADSAAKLRYAVDGGTLSGIENGDQSDCTEYTATHRHVYCGQAVAYVLVKGGADAVLTVTCDHYPEASVKLGE